MPAKNLALKVLRSCGLDKATGLAELSGRSRMVSKVRAQWRIRAWPSRTVTCCQTGCSPPTGKEICPELSTGRKSGEVSESSQTARASRWGGNQPRQASLATRQGSAQWGPRDVAPARS